MTIIVGTDGTGHGSAAVDWAAAEAHRRRTSLRIVHAYDGDWQESRFEIGNEYIDVARELADAVVAAAHDRARDAAPDVGVTTDTLIGHAVPRLLEASADAELLVLGSRGRGGFDGLRLGSVSQRMAAHAPCPVVVVHGRGDPAGAVVAGIDDSPAAEHVLATAFEAADARGAGLVAVRSFAPPIPHWLAEIRRAGRPAAEEDGTEVSRLECLLAPWCDKYPDVSVGTVLTHDTAAAALVAASHGAQLVVIGSRGHSAVGAALLGSVSGQLLHNAGCPVLVVRDEAAR